MIDPAEVERYRLPEEENRRIFGERIVPDQLEGRVSQETPTVVFLIGQPGAGKSRVTEAVAAVLNQRGGFVDIDSDLYKPYHPAYADLMAQDDTLMAAFTRADGRAWMALAEEYVRTHGLNAIIQETAQNAQAVEEKMRAYRQGSRLEGLFMGVPKALSDQGIVNRYFEQLADRGQGRLTVQANADESFDGILDLADRVDRGALVDLASVFRRGESKPRYSNSLDSAGNWTGEPTTRQAVQNARGLPLTKAESDAFVATQLRLREASRRLGAEWPARLARIEEQGRPLLTPAAAQRLGPARPSTAAARSRSTTASKKPPQQQGHGTTPRSGVDRSGPHRGPETPERKQGRGR